MSIRVFTQRASALGLAAMVAAFTLQTPAVGASGHIACPAPEHGCARMTHISCCCSESPGQSNPARPVEPRLLADGSPSGIMEIARFDCPAFAVDQQRSWLHAPRHGYHCSDLPTLLSTFLI